MSNSDKAALLIEAVMAWASDTEGSPTYPADARLLKALWSYEGDRTTACEECDGECGEPCAPCTVQAAHNELDKWISDYERRNGFRREATP